MDDESTEDAAAREGLRFDVLTNDGLDLAAMAAIDARPPPFAPGAEFWTDPYLSERLLEAHLDDSHGAASRPPERIDAEVEWLVETLELAPGDAVVDFGCGPGLYAERFADRGLAVTGLDASETAIEYARDRAIEAGHDVEYRLVDYREFAPGRAYDAAILINTDFGTFEPDDRRTVLERVRRALAEDGHFAFDVLPVAALPETEWTTDWELRTEDGGFWRPGPYLTLSASATYPDEAVSLDQHLVVEPDGAATTYRFWQQHYTPDSIEALLSAYGFDLEGTFPDLQGGSGPPDEDLLGVVAAAEES
jgi:SAM-dependent methyltransferase